MVASAGIFSTGVDEGSNRMLTPWKLNDDRGRVRNLTHSYRVQAANRERGEKVQEFSASYWRRAVSR